MPTSRPPIPPPPRQLDALADRPSKGLDLAGELRRLLVSYNRQLGAEAWWVGAGGEAGAGSGAR